MESVDRVWTNFSRQLDDPIMRSTNSLRRTVCTNFRVRLTHAFVGFRSYFTGEHVPTPQFASLGFVVSSLLSLLQLNTGGNPFRTHSTAILTAAICLLIYGLASDIELKFSAVRNARIYTNIARSAMMVFGSLLMASLASIFFSNEIQPVLFLVYFFVYTGPALLNWLHRRSLMKGTEVGGNQNARLPV